LQYNDKKLMKIKHLIISVILLLSGSLTLIPSNVKADTPPDPDSYKGVIDFLQNVKGGLSTKQPDFVNKQINDYTGELTVRKMILYVADRAISLFSVLAIVLLVIAGVVIIIKGADAGNIAKQGVNIAAILGSIFFMHLGRTVVGVFFQGVVLLGLLQH